MIYIYFMRTRLFHFLALASLVFFFNGCTPDEVETTQDQFKPLKIRVTLADPITQSDELSAISNWLSVQGTFNQSINGNIPNQVGQNTIEYSTTAVPNTPIYLVITYFNIIGGDGLGGLLYQCNTVNLEVIYNGQTVYTESREMGSEGGPCGDGYQWTFNYTVQ
jgi:hypothetical protein